MKPLFLLLSRSPLWLLHALGWLVGWIAFAGSGVYRDRFLANARQAGMAWRQIRTAVGESGKLLAELPRLWLGPPVPVTWDGDALIENALAAGRGIVFLTPHLGSFEITARAYARRWGVGGRPITVLYRPARKAWLGDLVDTARQTPGLHAVPTTLGGVRQLARALRQGHPVGLLPDQVPPQGLGVWAPFFGRDAYTMTLSARLAGAAGAVVLLAWGERLSRGRGFCVHLRSMTDALDADPDRAAVQVNAAMESLVREAPGQYLWGYARYKQPGAWQDASPMTERKTP